MSEQPEISQRRFNPTWLGLIAPAVIFITLAALAAAHTAIFFDIPVMSLFGGWRQAPLDTIFTLITELGSTPYVLVGMLVVAVTLIARRKVRPTVFITAAVLGAGVLDGVLKELIQSPRPDYLTHIVEETGYGFPSGHSMVSSALAFALMFLIWNTRWRWVGIGLGLAYILAVGASRIYLGVHFPSDVVGAWCASLIWVCALAYILRIGRTPHSAA